MTVRIAGARVLVTGAGRGLGAEFSRELLQRGAATVYGGARDPASVTIPGVTPVQLDITSSDQVAAAAKRCADVSILINNAGIMHSSPQLAAPDMKAARAEMETNYFGTLSMCRAFAPVLGANGGGALVNILSVTAWFANPLNSSYGASKSAAWSLTNAARIELYRQGTLVTGVFAGFIDTEMAALIDMPKISPASVVQQTLDGIEAGAVEVLTSDRVRSIKARLPHDQTEIYPDLVAIWEG